MSIFKWTTEPKNIYIIIDKEVSTSFYYDFTEHTETEIRDYWQWSWWIIQLDSSKWVYSAYGSVPASSWHSYEIYPTHTMTFIVTWTTRGSSWSNAGSELRVWCCWYHWNWRDFWYGWWWDNYRPGSSGGYNNQYTTTLIYDFDNLTIDVTHEVETYSTRTFSWVLWSGALDSVRSTTAIKFNPWTVWVKTIEILTT